MIRWTEGLSTDFRNTMMQIKIDGRDRESGQKQYQLLFKNDLFFVPGAAYRKQISI